MAINFLVQLLVAVALLAISFLLVPRPKVAKPREVQDLENPTAEAGRPVPVIFGTQRIESANVLWYGNKSTRKVNVG